MASETALLAETDFQKWALKTARGIEEGTVAGSIYRGQKYYFITADLLENEKSIAVKKALAQEPQT